MSNTQPFPYVSVSTVVDDVLRGLGLYTCGPDECAGWLEYSGPVIGSVSVSYHSRRDVMSPHPFTISEIDKIRQGVREMLGKIPGLEVLDVEYEHGDLPRIIVHWETSRNLSEVINYARESMAVSGSFALR